MRAERALPAKCTRDLGRSPTTCHQCTGCDIHKQNQRTLCNCKPRNFPSKNLEWVQLWIEFSSCEFWTLKTKLSRQPTVTQQVTEGAAVSATAVDSSSYSDYSSAELNTTQQGAILGWPYTAPLHWSDIMISLGYNIFSTKVILGLTIASELC